jgi:16S rRNA (uracil1498-N3)-methyltransferase
VTTAALAALVGGGAAAGAQRAVLVLDPVGDVRLSAWEPPADVDEIVLVVGPEGGIDGSEFDRLVDAGAVRVRLGDTVLRTSTAGPAALAVLQTRLGRW